MDMKYVFISHSSADKDLTDRLCDYLAKSKVCFWYDGMLTGGNYAAQIGTKLINASAYILVASEKALRSSEVQLEVEHMKGKLVVPLVLDDYYFEEDDGKGSITYTLGNNRIEAVIMSKFESEEKAFERLVFLLQPAIMTWQNDIRDFNLDDGGKKMLTYKGSDPFLDIAAPIEQIATRAVQGNKAVEAVQIGDTVKVIDESAFSGCKELKSVLGCGGVIRCKTDAFAGTALMQSDADVIKAGCIAIGGSGNDKLTVDGCRVIADQAFFGAFIQELELQEGVEYIGDSAFRCCLDLRVVTLPQSIIEVGDKAFYDCFSLEKIICLGKAPKGLINAQNKSNVIVEERQ